MKKTKKLAVVMGFLFLLAVIATAVPTFAATTGGWTASKARYSFLTSGQEKIFNKSVQGLTGVTYKPVALLAKQVVAGTNYVFLCQGTTVTAKPVKGWYILKANRNLKGKVSLVSIKRLKVATIKVNTNPRQGIASGGLWINAFRNKPEALAKGIYKIFSKGIEKYVGYELRPITLLGSQPVAGRNYRYLCYGTGRAGADLFVVDIYKDLKKKCSLTSCKPFNLENYID